MVSVGRSWRTPAKHELMRSIVGREVGVTGVKREIERLVWLDLTAGDGIPADGRDWSENCSPGILAHHATKSTKPVDISLYEIKPATFDRLVIRLKEELPKLGYIEIGDSWQYREHVRLRAMCADGGQAQLDEIRRGNRDAVLVSNDPNAITDWAMRSTFAAEVAERTPWFRCISTMGCNPAGLKRLGFDDYRSGWFDLVAQQEAALPRHRDLMLAAIQGDDSQWAYLLCEPVKWRDNRTVERLAMTCFRKYERTLDMCWYRTDRAAYEDLKRRLFLTKQERSGT